MLALAVTNMTNDVFFKVGQITLIGLSAKNAILIIEFAKQLMKEEKTLIDATLIALKQRLGNDSNLLIVIYVQIMPDDLGMQLHRF